MRVGRKIRREITLDVPSVKRPTAQPLLAEIGQTGSTLQEMISPQPGQAAERDFQAACPVNACGIWVRGLPMPPLPQDLICKAAVVGETVCFGKRHHVLMTIQFPCDLAIANLGIVQVMNFIKCFSRSSFLVNCVPMPVNLATVVKTGVFEQIEKIGR